VYIHVNDADAVSTAQTQTRIAAASARRNRDALRALIDADCVVTSVAVGRDVTILGRDARVAELTDSAGSDWVFQRTLETFREPERCPPLITAAMRGRVENE
jgi:hypothetical protein